MGAAPGEAAPELSCWGMDGMVIAWALFLPGGLKSFVHLNSVSCLPPLCGDNGKDGRGPRGVDWARREKEAEEMQEKSRNFQKTSELPKTTERLGANLMPTPLEKISTT